MIVVDIVEREESSGWMAAIKLCLNGPMVGVLAIYTLLDKILLLHTQKHTFDWERDKYGPMVGCNSFSLISIVTCIIFVIL